MQGLSPNLPRGRDIPLPCSGQRVTHLATVAAPSAETSRTAFNPKSGPEAGLNALAPRAPAAPARLRPRSGLPPASLRLFTFLTTHPADGSPASPKLS